MNGLYIAAGRWLAHTFMREAILGLSTANGYAHFRVQPAKTGVRHAANFLFNFALGNWSSNGNALFRLYHTLTREKSAGEGQYQQYQDWIRDMQSVNGFIGDYSRFMGER